MDESKVADPRGARFGRWVFTAAGVYGLLVLLPFYFLEDWVGRDQPPPVTHPEFYYGFLGVAVAWQLAFLAIGRDPVRHRPLMPAAVVEKFSFGIAAPALYLAGRVAAPVLIGASIDLVLGVLFVIAYVRTHAPGERPA